jgi:integrase
VFNLEFIGGIYYASWKVPKRLIPFYGRSRLRQTLKTDSYRQAVRLVIPIVDAWKRQGNVSPTESEALQVMPGPSISINSLIANVSLPSIHTHIDPWIMSLKRQGLRPKTIKGMDQDVRIALDAGLTLDKPSLMAYLNKAEDEGKSRVRIQGSIRSFWMFLKVTDVIQVDWPVLPPVRRKFKGRQANIPYTAEELQRLLTKLKNGKDKEVYRACLIASYTGCRINEVVNLKRQDICLKKDRQSLIIRESKTGAGVREVPLHPQIVSVFEDDWEFKDSSDALSKRFGRLTRTFRKKGQTFHSLRSSVVTFLEQAGVSENITAAIVGHKIQTMSYGLYSGGPSYEQKQIAINLIPNLRL